MAGPGAPRDFASPPTIDGASFADDVARLLDRQRAVGTRQVLAVDPPDPEIGVPVVRVVIPGLEGADDHPRYLPGRRALAARERRP
jgi:ribosomal protein S12 methylthiotransferase accessory factor